MKLAIICRPFVFHGGLERATAGLVAELVRRGIDLHLLTTRSQVEWPGVTIRRLPVCSTPSLARLLSFALSSWWAVKSGKYDLVQSHERTLAQDLYRAGEGCHRAWLEIRASRLTPRGRRLLYANPYHRTLLAFERFIFSPGHYRKLIAISELGRAEIHRLYRVPSEDIAVIYNGVDLARFSPEKRAQYRGEVRRRYGVSDDALLVLFVGSGFERKGLDTLIRALARLDERRIRLAIVGKGNIVPYQAMASQLGVAARIHWIGPLEDVETLYAASDLVALPARYEPFGNVHLEALAAGIGGSEILTPGLDGVIVKDPEDSVELATAIESVAEPARRRLWEEAARRTAERFSYASQVEQLIALYREVIQRP
jgi:UDP-glucose:(heptosyl)LPS alpha-1,3-glucosyltransferase